MSFPVGTSIPSFLFEMSYIPSFNDEESLIILRDLYATNKEISKDFKQVIRLLERNLSDQGVPYEESEDDYLCEEEAGDDHSFFPEPVRPRCLRFIEDNGHRKELGSIPFMGYVDAMIDVLDELRLRKLASKGWRVNTRQFNIAVRDKLGITMGQTPRILAQLWDKRSSDSLLFYLIKHRILHVEAGISAFWFL